MTRNAWLLLKPAVEILLSASIVKKSMQADTLCSMRRLREDVCFGTRVEPPAELRSGILWRC